MELSISFELPAEKRLPLFLGIGVFDGVHLGHRRIMAELAEHARRRNALPAALTFQPHPRAVLGEAPPALLPFPERCRLLKEAGAEGIGILHFDRATAALEPEEFLRQLLTLARPAGICVGENWRFGARGRGDRELLARFAAGHHLEFVPCPEVYRGNEVVSASRIRTATAAGELSEAEAMLGRRCRLFGKVVHGNGVAGSVLHAPTANLELTAGVLPPDGVYAASVTVGRDRFKSALNIGFSPTFGGKVRRIEAHLIGFSGELYEQELEVELFSFLRQEHRFSSGQELQAAIREDLLAINRRVQL